nr:MAG TPA: hypothetical protein [Caudoviricetes sp.]DAO88047.1 MAG TPA: hypothetical protein [Caudoviricetes sp.]
MFQIETKCVNKHCKRLADHLKHPQEKRKEKQYENIFRSSV